jgi:uncharacterized protein YndB with AHSA1/START domain
MSDKSNDFVISRDFDVPRETLWTCFTEPERMQQWWGPKGCKVIAANMDLRPGGFYHYGLQMPDGKTIWGKFVFREIVPPERMVFTNFFSDEKGGVTRHPLVPTWPLEMLSTFTFDDLDTRSRFTVRWTPHNATQEEREVFNSDAMRAGMTQGWSGTMDQLEEYLRAL